jgi:hypothetical protein
MEWLRKLLTPTLEAPRYGVESECVDPIDWTDLEDRLVALADHVIASFSKKHEGEAFYGLAFDCNSERGEVLVCLNTREGQISVAGQFEGNPKLYRGMSLAEIAAQLEWDLGGWKYRAINLGSRRWESTWGVVQAQIANATNIYLNSRNMSALCLLRESFMSMASRALLRVSLANSVSTLKKDAVFRVLCTDESEGPDEGFQRLSQIAASGT